MADLVDTFSLLKIANSPILSQFLNDCVDDLIKSKNITFDSYSSDIEWTIDDFTKAKNSIQKFYRECGLRQEERSKLEIEGLTTKMESKIENCFELRKQDIFAMLVKENLIKCGLRLVDNFDWKLRWILGTSKLASLRNPILQMNFCSLSEKSEMDGNIKTDDVAFEMDLVKLNLLISQLERACNEAKSES